MLDNQRKLSFEELQRARKSKNLVDLRYLKDNKKPEEVKPANVEKIRKKRNELKFSLPKLSLPKLSFPKLSLSKASLSKASIFQFNLHKRKKKSSLVLNFKNFSSFFSNYKKNLRNFKPTFEKKKKNIFLDNLIKEKKRILDSRFRTKKKKLELVETKLSWYRSLFSFALVLLFLVVPLKLLSYFQIFDLDSLESKVLNRSNAAIYQLSEAAHSVSQFDLESADKNFSQAGQEFLQAEADLEMINDSLLFLASLSNNPKIKLASESKKILAAGVLGSSLGKNLVLSTNKLFNYQEEISLLDALKDFSYYGSLAYEDAIELETVIYKIDESNLPVKYRNSFQDLKEKASFLSKNLGDIISLADKAYSLLGQTQDKRYLLIFQNNAELRASGGFLGSYALLDVRNGKIKNMEVPAGGSYDTEGGMTVNVKAPEPLWLVNPMWHFWDANWWPDWPKTAQNLMWFYEKSGGSTVDGVITFTPTVVEGLLDITGPIDMTKEHGVIIDSSNFWETVQKIVEHNNLLLSHPESVLDYEQSLVEIDSELPLYQDLETNIDNKPKKIIGDLMARILEILPEKVNEKNLVKIITLFETSIAEKHVMLYFTDNKLQEEAENRNLAGEVKESPHDYLMVVNTNIAGQKTDRKMSESIRHLSQVNEKGQIVNSLKITRLHEGIKNEALSGVRNVNWLRIYLPLGSRLISASGFSNPDAKYFEEPDSSWLDSDFLEAERLAVTDLKTGLKVYAENGKTVIAGWVMTDPGQMADIRLSYELPFNFFEDVSNDKDNFWNRLDNLLNSNSSEFIKYSLLVQKQPGAKASSFSSQLILPGSVELAWKYPSDMSWNSGWSVNKTIDRDRYFSLLLNNIYDN